MKEIELESISDLYLYNAIGLLDSFYWRNFNHNYYQYVLFSFSNISDCVLVVDVKFFINAESRRGGNKSIFSFNHNGFKRFKNKPDNSDIVKELI